MTKSKKVNEDEKKAQRLQKNSEYARSKRRRDKEYLENLKQENELLQTMLIKAGLNMDVLGMLINENTRLKRELLHLQTNQFTFVQPKIQQIEQQLHQMQQHPPPPPLSQEQKDWLDNWNSHSDSFMDYPIGLSETSTY